MKAENMTAYSTEAAESTNKPLKKRRFNPISLFKDELFTALELVFEFFAPDSCAESWMQPLAELNTKINDTCTFCFLAITLHLGLRAFTLNWPLYGVFFSIVTDASFVDEAHFNPDKYIYEEFIRHLSI